MSVKKQLRAFYVKQGLTGKHFRKAMQHDMKAVRANCDKYSRPESDKLSGCFVFKATRQGFDYWADRHQCA